MRVRVRPWSERELRSSLGRLTVMVFSSRAAVMGLATVCFQRSLRALDGNKAVFNLDLDAGRHGDGETSNT